MNVNFCGLGFFPPKCEYWKKKMQTICLKKINLNFDFKVLRTKWTQGNTRHVQRGIRPIIHERHIKKKTSQANKGKRIYFSFSEPVIFFPFLVVFQRLKYFYTYLTPEISDFLLKILKKSDP